jgi:hypothetical protein
VGCVNCKCKCFYDIFAAIAKPHLYMNSSYQSGGNIANIKLDFMARSCRHQEIKKKQSIYKRDGTPTNKTCNFNKTTKMIVEGV